MKNKNKSLPNEIQSAGDFFTISNNLYSTSSSRRIKLNAKNRKRSKGKKGSSPRPPIEDKIIKSGKRGFQFTGEIKTVKSQQNLTDNVAYFNQGL